MEKGNRSFASFTGGLYTDYAEHRDAMVRSTKPKRRALGWAPLALVALFASTYACASHGGDAQSYGEERFSVCPQPQGEIWGTGEVGAPCEDARDCRMECCLCSHGPTEYAYAACKESRCASVCDPVNNTRAPICDGATSSSADCWTCGQILNEALADGDDLGDQACADPAASSWAALKACAQSSCGAACPIIQPTSACVDCLQRENAASGCANEYGACLAH